MTAGKKAASEKQTRDSSIESDPSAYGKGLDHVWTKQFEFIEQTHHPHITELAAMRQNMDRISVHAVNRARLERLQLRCTGEGFLGICILMAGQEVHCHDRDIRTQTRKRLG
jgi:hypothetical protein